MGVQGFDDVLAANDEYVRGFAHGGLDARPARSLAVVTCMDGRLDPLAMLGLEPGDANVLRNAGARIDDHVLADLALAAGALGVRRIAVVAHTDCRAVKSGQEELLRADVERIRSSVELEGLEAAGFVYDVETGRLSRVC